MASLTAPCTLSEGELKRDRATLAPVAEVIGGSRISAEDNLGDT